MVLKNIFRFSLSLAIVFTLFQGLVFAEISSSPVFDFVNKETNDFTGLDYKNVKPGDTISGTTQLILKSGNETDFYIKLVENDDSGKNIKVEDSIVSQSNLNITKSIVRLKEGDTKEINFSIKIPENTELGDHIALIVASYKSKENVNVGLGIPINIEVVDPYYIDEKVSSNNEITDLRKLVNLTVLQFKILALGIGIYLGSNDFSYE